MVFCRSEGYAPFTLFADSWVSRGAKATVLDCMGGDGEGICASLQA